MKKVASIKKRITLWYTSLMFVIIAIVLLLVGTLSYQFSIDRIEKDVVLQVSQVSERFLFKRENIFHSVDSNKHLKNVSIHDFDGNHIAGQYIYDVESIPFHDGPPRRETVDGKEYIVYDVRKPAPPNIGNGFWIRGCESVNSTVLLGRSAFTVILIIIPLILLLTALGGYYITKKAFSPINNIIRTADKICSENDVRQRIEINPLAKKDELYDLSVTLNTMLDKIQSLIMQEKQFSSDASHELRTPISVILAQGEYLLDIADTEKEKELAQNIVDKANQVSKLVSELLLLARIDQNRQKIKTEKVNLGVLTDIAIDNAKDLADKKNITFITNVDEDILVNADEPLLLSAITNLITNAVKYGKESGTVTVVATKGIGIVKITVKDDGIGISEEKLGKIWERFYRTDDVRNDEYGSSGLGLSVVKSIVELHGGKVTVSSKENVGTEFTITLKENCNL